VARGTTRACLVTEWWMVQALPAENGAFRSSSDTSSAPSRGRRIIAIALTT